jgi:hypothetical protein
MKAIALAAPVIPEKLEAWKKWSQEMSEGAKKEEFAAFINKAAFRSSAAGCKRGRADLPPYYSMRAKTLRVFSLTWPTPRRPFRFGSVNTAWNAMDLTSLRSSRLHRN